MEFDSIDRISELPDFVMHSILSLLRRKDAARTSVLSKRWNHVWETFPDLIFDRFTYTRWTPPHHFGEAELTPEPSPQVVDFLDIVKRSLLRSTRGEVRGIKFVLRAGYVDPRLSSELDECLELALRSGATTIDISSDFTLPETVFVSSPFQNRSLQKLALQGISLTDESINDVFLSCPNMYSISLSSIPGIRKLHIHKLDRLEEVMVSNVYHLRVCIIDAPKLRSFCLRNFGEYKIYTLDLSSCRCLRKLNLGWIRITDEWLRSTITLNPLLEDLAIDSCDTLRKVTISAKCLTRLNLSWCDKVEAIEINAPALLSFKHKSEALPRLILKTIPTQVVIVYPLTRRSPIDTSRFVNMRKFLAISTRIDCLTVQVYAAEVVFDREELMQIVVPQAFQLQHLRLYLQVDTASFDVTALTDGLLWCFHPKTISVFWTNCPMLVACVKVLRESLLNTERNPSCCSSAQVKCWRHDLKSATARMFGEYTLVVRFELEWYDSIS